MKEIAFSLAICLVVLPGCSNPDAPGAKAKADAAETVQVDLATPDKALKSYWAVRDAVRKKHEKLVDGWKKDFLAAADQLSSVAHSAVFEFKDGLGFETFSRDIIDVKIESESRAVVVAVIKNTTPIPAGAEPSKFDEERRRDGQRYKYVLEKGQTGWRVAEIWEWRTYPSPDWSRNRPDDGKPLTPSLTHDGI